MSRKFRFLLLVSFIPAAFAESASPSIRFTGAPADGGQTCVTCHTGTAVNAGGGSISVSIGDYTPSITQLVKVVVQDSSAKRWGFQITIRQVSNETLEAGNFTVAGTPNTQVRCDDGSQFGTPGPCSQTREFGEHLNAPTTAPGAGFEFDLNWMPPSSEVGDLHVYITAVAANNDGTAAGDHVYFKALTISPVGGCSIPKKPTLQTIENGASFQSPFTSNTMVSIFGLGFQVAGVTRTAGLGDLVNNNAFPTTLACVSIQVTGPGIAAPGVLLPIAYVQQDQINAEMPLFSGPGPVTLKVLINAGKPNELDSDVAMINAQAFAPAFFTFGTSNSIAAQFAGTASIVANPSVVAGASPAKVGDIITLYGTGFGPTNPSVPTGQLDSGQANLTTSITVMIGNVTLASSDVLYAGLSPGSINGLYQFNVRVPAGAGTGNVPVVITIGGVQTQSGATIPLQ